MNNRQRKIEALDYIYLVLIGMRGFAESFTDLGQDEEMKMWDAVEDIAISLKIRADKLKSKKAK